MKFTLAIEFVDGNHTTTDRWKSISKDDVLKAIVDHLDILHRDWVPYEPDFDRIRTNFIKFNPYDAEKYAQSEYKRCLDGYVAYQRVYRDLSMLSEIEPDNVSPLTYEVDKQTTILVVVE